MKQYYPKNDARNKNKLRYRILIIVPMLMVLYGITAVNMNLADVAKNKSSFSVKTSNNPPKVVLDIGEEQVIFNTKIFTDFKNGTIIIIKTVKNTIISLGNWLKIISLLLLPWQKSFILWYNLQWFIFNVNTLINCNYGNKFLK